MIEVKDKKTLLNLKNHKEDELIKVLDENKIYQFKENDWVEYEAPKFNISLYDINKQFYDAKDNLTDEELNNCKDIISQYRKLHNSNYYLLLNNGLRYYTVFAITNNGDNFEDEVISIIKDFDYIKAIELVEGAVEVWASLNGYFGCFMLFDYGKGVVECQ